LETVEQYLSGQPLPTPRTEPEPPSGKTVVVCDVELQNLVPMFLERREQDIRSLTAGVAAGDFATVQSLGHGMKGAGGGYGFPRITEIGAALEEAGREADAAAAARWTEELSQYLKQIEVQYE
jgi:HPt (histidine-containing phosphotransfer) domain-containing protein